MNEENPKNEDNPKIEDDLKMKTKGVSPHKYSSSSTIKK